VLLYNKIAWCLKRLYSMELKGKKWYLQDVGDNEILDIFDRQQVYRQYGFLSHDIISILKATKKKVATERKKAMKNVEAIFGYRYAKQKEDDGDVEPEDEDYVSLDREEFCALLHMLDDVDDAYNFRSNHLEKKGVPAKKRSYRLGESSNEKRIADLIFEAYGRKMNQKQNNGFRARIEGKLDEMVQLLKASHAESEVHPTRPSSGGVDAPFSKARKDSVPLPSKLRRKKSSSSSSSFDMSSEDLSGSPSYGNVFF